LNKSYPNTFDLFICGSGSLEIELKKLADNNIYFLGKINQEEVPTFLYTLDIFLNTIEFESFGVSTIEAMACGLPVIAYKAGGAEEIIQHDENGIL
jgi:glycosyltransferase involved in cell wall biosynthesis